MRLCRRIDEDLLEEAKRLTPGTKVYNTSSKKYGVISEPCNKCIKTTRPKSGAVYKASVKNSKYGPYAVCLQYGGSKNAHTFTGALEVVKDENLSS